MRNLFTLLTTVFFFSFVSNAQTVASLNTNDMNFTYSKDNKPRLSSRVKSIKTWKSFEGRIIQKLHEDVVYPEIAISDGIDGSVIVEFTFNGEVQDAKIIKSSCKYFDKAVLEVMKNVSKYYKDLGGQKIDPISIKMPFRFTI